MDINQAANRLGIPAKTASPSEVRDALAAMLNRLNHDVDGDQDIQDGHVRFGEHVAVMGLAGDLDPVFEAALDTMSWDDPAAANAVERIGIQVVRSRFL
jgi:hypothetical protein